MKDWSASAPGLVMALLSLLATAGRQSLAQYMMRRDDQVTDTLYPIRCWRIPDSAFLHTPQAELSVVKVDTGPAKGGKRFDPTELLLWQSIIAAPCLFILWFANVGEERHGKDPAAGEVGTFEFWQLHFAKALGFTLGISALAIGYSIVMFWFTQLTSALTVSIAGSVKMVVLIVVPEVLDVFTTGRANFSAINWVGTVFFFGGVFSYAALSYRESQARNVGTKERAVETTLLNKSREQEPQGCFCVRLC